MFSEKQENRLNSLYQLLITIREVSAEASVQITESKTFTVPCRINTLTIQQQ